MSAGVPKACLIGHPIAHSLSPVLHGGWLKDLGLTGAYEALDVAPADLGAAVERLRAEGYRGANITIPHKVAVRAHLDAEDENASAIGAVNTLVIDRGRITGSNTDAFGYVAHLEAEFPRWREMLGARPVLVLGAGGAARAVVYGLAQAGAQRILIANRSRDRSARLAANLASFATIETLAWEDRERAASDASLIVNATSLGMRGEGALALSLSGVESAIVCDLAYNPLETPLLRAARASGLPALDGLGMLIHQGRPGFKAWFGAEPPMGEHVRARLLRVLAGR
jgi:shikimate dehydrogenase